MSEGYIMKTKQSYVVGTLTALKVKTQILHANLAKEVVR